MAKINVKCKTNSLEEYRRLAALAKEFGATHLEVNQIEPSMWMWDINRYDPYPNWGLENPTLFKFIVPEELKKYYPAEYAARNLEMLKARAEILKEFGLKASFHGMEPAYMPEAVYRDHPEWRGPRCDQTRRARTEYFAPCLDNEELRAIYVKAVAELCKAAPIEVFTFLTNDSGGGLCWAEELYPGKNGPMACAHIPMGTRIARYLSIFQEGAALAGLKAEAGVLHVDDRDMIASLPSLLPGQSINNRTTTGAAATATIGLSVPYSDHAAPVALLPRMVKYAEHIQTVGKKDDCNITIAFRSVDDLESIAFVKKYFRNIGNGPAAIYNALTDFAADLVGKEHADKLVEVWDLIEKCIRGFDFLETGGHIFLLGSIHQRWLTRPFVAFPGELTPEEKNYYREYQFQAQSEEDADNMCDLQANCWLSGYGAANLLEKCIHTNKPYIDKAITLLTELLEETSGASYNAQLKKLLLRARLYRCVIRNAGNAVQFQNILDRTDYSVTPKDTSPHIREQGDIRYFKVNQLLRNEVDNTLEIISILKEDISTITHVEVKFKSVMNYGSDIIDDLKKKITIMENHRRDFERLYKSYNR